MTLNDLAAALEEAGIGADEPLEFFKASSHYNEPEAVAINKVGGIAPHGIFVQRRVEPKIVSPFG